LINEAFKKLGFLNSASKDLLSESSWRGLSQTARVYQIVPIWRSITWFSLCFRTENCI